MRHTFLCAIHVLVLFLPASAAAQSRVGFPAPPPSMDQKSQAQAPDQTAAPRRHADLAQAQREAADLSRMAQTIPSDVAKIREGMLPKDVIEKLKLIEKLSKRLRSELAP